MQLIINIENKKLKEQISRYITDNNQEKSEFVLEAIIQFFQKEKNPLLSKEEIAKVVENSQRIEGYEPVSKAYELEVEAFMRENGLEISA